MSDQGADRQSQVTREREELDSAIQRLSESIEELETRLGNVMRLSEPTPDEDQKQEELVPLANQLRTLRSRVQALNDRLISLRNRLEN